MRPGGYEYFVENVPPTPSEVSVRMQTGIAANGDRSTFFVNLDAVNNPSMPRQYVFEFAQSAFRMSSDAPAPSAHRHSWGSTLPS